MEYVDNALGVVLEQRYTDIQKSAQKNQKHEKTSKQVISKLGLFHFKYSCKKVLNLTF